MIRILSELFKRLSGAPGNRLCIIVYSVPVCSNTELVYLHVRIERKVM